MICSKGERFKPIKSKVPGPGAYEVSVCVCEGKVIECMHVHVLGNCPLAVE